MTEKYDVYGAEPSQDDLPWELRDDPHDPATTPLEGVSEAPSEGGWCVVVEYTNSLYDKPPTVLRVLDDGLDTREQAQRIARRRAFDFEPPDPLAPQLREVYEDDPGFVTIIQGATRSFHFTTRVVRFLGVRQWGT